MKKTLPLLSILMLLTIGLFAQETEIKRGIPPTPPPPVVSEEIFQVKEEMPYLSSCKNEVGEYAKKKCSDEKLMAYVYENLIYPDLAKSNNVQGTVVIRFAINQDGKMSDAIILRDIGAGCGKAGLAVIEKLIQDNLQWKPSTQRGKSVDMLFNLPIKFRLPKKE